MTCVRTWPGWVHVAFVGWWIAGYMLTELPLDALGTVLWRRRAEKDSGLIQHRDRGPQ
ncbi:hypothetical protein Kpho01_24860 [Kitasatospora phosalacinea]|uniref:Uncharacterized protein n=1 Tax=Kitasatospora phosalacinea TaxID=2065 RepID=A0A9W6PG80_9ACTN|nr:hypothetical protein Kpho01_24860 [Kitasatospora phosalacinea]